MSRPKGTIQSDPDKWCPYCASSEAAITDPDERIAGLKAENKKLRDRLREIAHDEDDSLDVETTYWQTTHGVRDWYFAADCGWPNHLPGYRGRVRLVVNYGGGSEYRTWQFCETYEAAEEYAARLNELFRQEAPGFHWRYGTFFVRDGDGSVDIVRRPTPPADSAALPGPACPHPAERVGFDSEIPLFSGHGHTNAAATGWERGGSAAKPREDQMTFLQPPTDTAEGWRPIDTAPKERRGPPLLLWGRFTHAPYASWTGVQIGQWSELAECWAVSCLPFDPTHWMPLPSAPKGGEGDNSSASIESGSSAQEGATSASCQSEGA